MTIDKLVLARSLSESIRAELERARKAQRTSQSDANEAEGAMVSRYDTFKEEAQYLADAQKLRIATIERGLIAIDQFRHAAGALARRDRIAVGAVAKIAVDGEANTVFLAPAGGGTTLSVEGITITVVTPESPLGRALLGRKAGECLTARVGPQERAIEVGEVT